MWDVGSITVNGTMIESPRSTPTGKGPVWHQSWRPRCIIAPLSVRCYYHRLWPSVLFGSAELQRISRSGRLDVFVRPDVTSLALWKVLKHVNQQRDASRGFQFWPLQELLCLLLLMNHRWFNSVRCRLAFLRNKVWYPFSLIWNDWSHFTCALSVNKSSFFWKGFYHF